MHRHELTDSEWVRLEPLLPAESGYPGPRRAAEPGIPQRGSLHRQDGRTLARPAHSIRTVEDHPHSVRSLESSRSLQDVAPESFQTRRRIMSPTSPTARTQKFISMALVEKGGPASMRWTLSWRSHHQNPRSRGRSRKSPPRPPHRNCHDVSQAPTLAEARGQNFMPTRPTARRTSSPKSGNVGMTPVIPMKSNTVNKTEFDPRTLKRTPRRRALLQQAQTISPHRNPLREARNELPRLRAVRVRSDLARMTEFEDTP